MLVTDALAAWFGMVGIAFVVIWLSPLEAETLNVGHLLRLGEPDPRVSTLVVGVGACVLGALVALFGRIRGRPTRLGRRPSLGVLKVVDAEWAPSPFEVYLRARL